MKLSKLKTNSDSERNGVWVNYNHEVSFLLARMHNPNYNKKVEMLSTPYKHQIRTNSVSDEVWLELSRKAFAETILLDWKGIEDDDGPIKSTLENKMAILEDEELHDLVEWLHNQASNSEIYREQEKDIEHAKKS